MRIWNYFTGCVLVLFLAGSPLSAESAAKDLFGKRRITKTLPAQTISCWGDRQARRLIGSDIEYIPGAIRWKQVKVNYSKVTSRVVTAKQYHDESSGQGTLRSQVTFQQLGIKSPEVVLISFEHEPATVTDATAEIPGDEVLIKDRSTIVFGVCNVYFEAKRRREHK